VSLTVSDICLKLGCFQSTGTYSTLVVLRFMRYISSQLLTHLLTNMTDLLKTMIELKLERVSGLKYCFNSLECSWWLPQSWQLSA